jgi:biopolymer transport protein ExbD
MAEETQLSEEERIIAARSKSARRGRGKRAGEAEPGLNINSMMDMMVIILVFLLKSYGAEPIQLIMSITKQWVMIEDESVTPISDGTIDVSHLQSAESAIIPELQQSIEAAIQDQEAWARLAGREYERVVTIVSDSKTPYRVLTQVMITATSAGITNFKFAILQRGQGSGLAAPAQ